MGGVVGAPARLGVAQVLPAHPGAFPTATYLTNLSGALLLGLLLEALARSGTDEGRRRAAHLSVGVGFCGAFTTYSTFTLDTDQLLRAGRWGVAVAYVVVSVVGGLAATGIGIALGARLGVRPALDRSGPLGAAPLSPGAGGTDGDPGDRPSCGTDGGSGDCPSCGPVGDPGDRPSCGPIGDPGDCSGEER